MQLISNWEFNVIRLNSAGQIDDADLIDVLERFVLPLLLHSRVYGQEAADRRAGTPRIPLSSCKPYSVQKFIRRSRTFNISRGIVRSA